MSLSRHFPFNKLLQRFILVALTTCSILFATPVLAASQKISQCQDFTQLPVALGPNQPATSTIFGQLCNPAGGPSKVVLLLLHGATYDHYYWDWPNTPTQPGWSAQYSAVRALNAAGYSTFNIDRIGIGPPPAIAGGPTLVGGSSQPASNLIDITANAYVVHTVVTGLRNGSVNGTSLGVSFTKVILVGHSFGSIIAIEEIATYQDVDGVILTGGAHKINPNLPLFLVQASTDPGAQGRFATLDAGYLTTQDGTRGEAFYYGPTSDPNVVAFDEETKQTVTAAEINQALSFLFANPSPTVQITVPVLMLVGQFDAQICNVGTGGSDCSGSAAFQAQEAPFFPNAPSFQAQVIPEAGHDLNLHYTAHQTYSIMGDWALANFPPNG